MRASRTLQVQIGAMDELEDFVAAFAGECGLAADDRARTLIVLEELLTNLVKYGYPDQQQQEGVAEISLELKDDKLTIEFGDDGQAFDPLSKPALDFDRPTDDRPVGGLGIHMVRELADEVQYVRINDRNLVRLTRRVSLNRIP